MKPPIVFEVIIPSSHKISITTAMVQSMIFSFIVKCSGQNHQRQLLKLTSSGADLCASGWSGRRHQSSTTDCSNSPTLEGGSSVHDPRMHLRLIRMTPGFFRQLLAFSFSNFNLIISKLSQDSTVAQTGPSLIGINLQIIVYCLHTFYFCRKCRCTIRFLRAANSSG